MKFRLLFLVTVLFGLAGCASKEAGRYSIDQDHGPAEKVDLSHVPDATPKYEPKSRGGNKSPYTVFGKQYYVMPTAADYRHRGTASWYGKKFHGHKTSNGEVYDMYGMTAAHKALPLPTYVKVTNLENGRQVIVRVNDRGPFHGNRVIDLSYAAAFKLDMLKKGTAYVEVEAIDTTRLNSTNSVISSAAPVPQEAVKTVAAPVISATSAPEPVAVATADLLQVGAYSSADAAEKVKYRLEPITQGMDILIKEINVSGKTLYRVQVGPAGDAAELTAASARIEAAGFPKPLVVKMK